MVVLTFAFTVHETQGQTLRKIILLLGRLPGMNIGRITWSLLYVALSRAKRLRDIKFFPTGSTKYYHSMYFAHLLKLRMPENLKKWHRSYVHHSWDRNILRNEHARNVRIVENRLEQLGEDKTKSLQWKELHSLAKHMGYKVTTRDNKMAHFCLLKEHMVKQLLWKTSKDSNSGKIRSYRSRKRAALEIDTKNADRSNSLRQSHRLRKRTESKLLLNTRHGDRLGRPKKKKRTKNYGEHETKMFFPSVSHPNRTRFTGLENLGQTCFFNSITQCLFHCPLFRETIKNIPQAVLSVSVLRELRLLFTQMGKKNSLGYLKTLRCFSAAANIPECKEANMNKNTPEDAGEFFLRLVKHFSEKFKRLADIFEGDLQSTLTCQGCFQIYIKTEPFGLLPLSFPTSNNEHEFPYRHDVYDFLDEFQKPEIISGYNCAHCPAQHPTEKTLDILCAPKVLVLQLKRFEGLQKIEDYVRFPVKLRLNYKSMGNEQQQLYRLTGVVCHKGRSIANGHYVAYVLAEEKWMRADDSNMQEVQYKTVKMKEAYLLFYLRL